MKLSVVIGFQSEEINQWSRRYLLPGSKGVNGGLACFNAVTDMGCGHEVHMVGSGPKGVEHPAFHWVNTMLGNVKNALRGTYHAFKPSIFPDVLQNFTIDLTADKIYRALSQDFYLLQFVRLRCRNGC